jgi:hypothetical protein
VVTRPPAELANSLRASRGIEVADVPVHRDNAVSTEARDRNARAFTRGARVHIPVEAGDLTSGPARGLLAHELVHAAQQRRLGGTLPAESSQEGQALEREALEAERAHGGAVDLSAHSEPLRHAPPPVSAAWVDDRITQHAGRALDRPSPTPYSFVTTEANRDEVEYLAQKVIREAMEAGVLGAGGGGGGSFSGNNQDFSVGKIEALDEEDYAAAILAAYNTELAKMGLPPQSQLTDAQRTAADAQFHTANLAREAEKERKKKFDEMRAKRKEAESKLTDTADKVKEQHWEKGMPGVQDGAGPEGTKEGLKDLGSALHKVSEAQEGSAEEGVALEGATTEAGKVDQALEQAKSKTAAKTPEIEKKKQAHVWAMSKLEDDPVVTKDDIRSWDDFYDAALNTYNTQRTLMGLTAVAGFEGAQLTALQAQYDSAFVAAMQKQVKDKKKEDDKYIRDKRAQREANLKAGIAVEDDIDGEPPSAPDWAEHPVSPRTRPSPRTITTTQALDAEHHAEKQHSLIDDLDEVTDRIYDRIRRKLRSELIIDRERAGLLTDFR